jgi:glycosyltransferase involved in cell wall biosynthesis
MKILLASSFFPPTHTEGTEKRTLGYALSLQKLGHDVQVICAGTWNVGGKYWNGFTDESYRQIPVRRIHLNWTMAPDPNQYLYRNPVVERAFGAWLDQWQPDIVHITSCYTLSASVIQAAKSRRLPVLLTLTDFWFICPRLSLERSNGALCDGRTTSWECLECMLWDSKLYRRVGAKAPKAALIPVLQWISRRASINRSRGLRGLALNMDERKSFLGEIIRTADAVVAPSAYLAGVVEAAGVSRPVLALRSGHDLSWLEDLPEKSISPFVRFGYIGQVSPNKGVHVLVAALKSVSQTRQAQLHIFGDHTKNPEYTRHLERLAAGSEVEVLFHGGFPHERLGQVLAEIDILVVPSTWHENNPRVIQESFAGKTPVIASKVGGIAEFVQHEENGLLFERGSAADLARQMQRVIDEPDLLERLAKCIPPVKTMEAEVNELEVIYRELVERGQIAPAPQVESQG